MKSARVLREKMASGKPVIGMMCTNHFWLQLIELAMTAGLDYIIVDLEHQDHGSTLVSDACMIGRLTNFPVLIRPARTDRESIRLAVDAGPCGLLCPMVNTVDQMDLSDLTPLFSPPALGVVGPSSSTSEIDNVATTKTVTNVRMSEETPSL